MNRKNNLRSPGAALLTGAALCTLGLFAATPPGYTDDRDLLRFTSAKPYLFILLDTSTSMNLKVGADVALVGGADNPDSRMYAAKQALYNVFSTVDDVHFGFASFNQDGPRVVTKHYLYYNATALPAAAAWPIPFPATDADGLTQYVDRLNLTGADIVAPIGTPDDVDGIPETVVADIEGDVLTVGSLFDLNGNGLDAADQETGTCAAPRPLGALDSTERKRVQSFAFLNTQANPIITTMWISHGGRTYRMRVGRPATKPDTTPNAAIGADQLAVTFVLDRVSACPATFDASYTYTTVMRQDPRFRETVIVDQEPAGGDGSEPIAGLWSWSDAIVSATCAESKPFSGKGWEGNYDSGDVPPAGITLAAGYPQNVDRSCVGANCVEIKPVQHTTYSAQGRALDRGDVLPFDWNNPNLNAMLQRLAPNTGVDTPIDFGVASHLVPSASVANAYEPRLAGRAPLLAAGNSPLSKSVLDFRCWYTGSDSNKCSASATADIGWGDTACTYDPEFGCRRPYLIVISDGGDNCAGENPAADTAGMNSKAGIQTWALNLGTSGCKPPLHSMTQNGKGECVDVSDPEDLLDTIKDILNKIREEARTFASAAVPSVQAVADQAIYLTDFTPLNNSSRWPGHLNSFLKPLPLTLDGRPDRSRACTGDQIGCFTWDAGVVMRDQPVRYVFYGQRSRSGLWAPRRTLFSTTTSATPGGIRYDLWKGFGLVSEDTPTNGLPAALESAIQTQANQIVSRTLELKTRSGPCNPAVELCTYKLGDIFHSDPLVFGQPLNANFFRSNSGVQFNSANASCTDTDEMADTFDRSYSCFMSRHRTRRQVVFVGSNDGMLHAFNAAQFRPSSSPGGDNRYDTGTGHELFAYMPRPVMPAVKRNSEGPEHNYTVDGPVQSFDAFIDPVDDGDGNDYPVASERRWRTVLLGGLREGGRGYYALDVTQPDVLVEDNGAFVPSYGSPSWAPSCITEFTFERCGPVPYGSPLWEFTDTTDNQDFPDTALQPSQAWIMDEDSNGLPDLGYTWSQIDLARIQVCASGTECTLSGDGTTTGTLSERYVAIFGGGMDPERKAFDPRSANPTDPDGGGPKPPVFELMGHWLYMVDVETGEVLYKRQLCSPYRTNAANAGNPCVPGGSAPAEVAAIDSDLNGFVDRVYVGTLGGYLYRVDLETVVRTEDETTIRIAGPVPITVNALDGNALPAAVTVRRVPEPLWVPRVIFDANWNEGTATTLPRPIYFRPAVLNTAPRYEGSTFAIAFGTGDREDLWNAPVTGGQTGRFYMFLEGFTDGQSAPDAIATEQDLRRVTVLGATAGGDLLAPEDGGGDGGWFMELAANERVITDPFSFSGVTFFSTFRPQIALTDSSGNPLSNVGTCGQKQYDSNTTASCAKTGNSYSFLVNTTNGDGLYPGNVRQKQIASFVTNPFTEFTTGSTDADVAGGANADTVSPEEDAVRQAIMALFPPDCRFTNARIDIRTISADTKLQEIGTIPVCMTTNNWKEF